MGPFCRHIIDAIGINLYRLFLYAGLSFGLSVPVSLGLIIFEVTILPLAFYYDLMNRLKWKKVGWALLNEDFIDMKWTPEFKRKTTDIPNGSFSILLVNRWRNEITNLLKENQWQKANNTIKAIREGLSNSNTVYPLINHFLESVHRCIALTVNWEKEKGQGLDSRLKEKFLKHRLSLCWWQMVGFEGALMLDLLSWPLRKKGLPILIQDVPHIPVPEEV